MIKNLHGVILLKYFACNQNVQQVEIAVYVHLQSLMFSFLSFHLVQYVK